MDSYQKDRLCMKQLGIRFLGRRPDIESSSVHLFQTFTRIREFENYRFSAYYTDDSKSIGHRVMWGNETKERAKRITETVLILLEDSVSEMEWRLRLEELILARFRLETDCGACLKRLWRSEVEAVAEIEDKVAVSLAIRRKDRQPCICIHQRSFTGGVNKMFSSRADELIRYNPFETSKQPPLMTSKGRKNYPDRKRRPDRIIGFQETHSFGRTLDHIARKLQDDAGTKTIRELVELVEAKCPDGDSFSDCDTQTAYPIWKMLKIQEELHEKTQEKLTYGGPLLWYTAYRGSDWRVSGCYTSDRDGKPSYEILELWSGDLRTEDGALQLLLIMDYIFDWARDIYKPTIMNQLKALTPAKQDTNETHDSVSQMATDSDILSLAGRKDEHIAAWFNTTIFPEEPQSFEEVNLEVWENLGFKGGFFRPACIVSYEFQCLYITKDNVNDFISAISETNTTELVPKIMTILQMDSLMITEHVLRRMEEVWTNKSRPQQPGYIPDRSLYATVVHHSEISGDWEIQRIISCLALDRDAFDSLRNFTKYKSSLKFLIKARTLTERRIEILLKDIQNQSVKDNFGTAIARTRQQLCPVAGSVSSSMSPGFEFINVSKYPHVENAIIRTVYNMRRLKSQEPKDTYLRFSQHSSTSANSSGASMISAEANPTSSLINDYSLVVFLKKIGWGYITCSLCLYETTGIRNPPSKSELAEALKAAVKKGDLFVYGHKCGVNEKCCRNLKTIRAKEREEEENILKAVADWRREMQEFLPKIESPTFPSVGQESNLNPGKHDQVSLRPDDFSHVAPDLFTTQGFVRIADKDNYLLSVQKSRNGPVEILRNQRTGRDITISSTTANVTSEPSLDQISIMSPSSSNELKLPEQNFSPDILGKTPRESEEHTMFPLMLATPPQETENSSLAPPIEKAIISSTTSPSKPDVAPSDSKRQLRRESIKEETVNRKKRKAYSIPAETHVIIIDE
ncbi:hypothetical protein B7463_g7079, partial [Scytalidium lignicola]